MEERHGWAEVGLNSNHASASDTVVYEAMSDDSRSILNLVFASVPASGLHTCERSNQAVADAWWKVNEDVYFRCTDQYWRCFRAAADLASGGSSRVPPLQDPRKNGAERFGSRNEARQELALSRIETRYLG